jgi:ribokinase
MALQHPTVLVAGSANLDFVVRADRIPAPGETVLGQGLATHPGGKGANQAVACARAGGVATRMLLGLGADAFAHPVEQSLAAAGVQMVVRRFDDLATGAAFITVDAAGENAITVASGANAGLRADDLPPLDGVDVLLLQLESALPAVTAWAHTARSCGVKVVLNAAPAQPLGAELLGCLDVLIANEGELAAVCADSRARTLDERLCSVDVPCVVVTLGARGCLARTPQGRIAQPAFAVEVVDTTAAGDTFCGTLAAALARRDPWPQALREASAAAALACTRPGAQPSIPSREQVLALLRTRPVPAEP